MNIGWPHIQACQSCCVSSFAFDLMMFHYVYVNTIYRLYTVYYHMLSITIYLQLFCIHILCGWSLSYH